MISMQVSPQTDAVLHSKLPIDKDEKVLAVYQHHWFAYASLWLMGGLTVAAVMVLAITAVALGGEAMERYRTGILLGATLFSLLMLCATYVPVYLRSQEQLVLTDEALLQVLRPSIFASKIDQLGLQRIDDVSVSQDFFGTMFGYGHLTIETPGEQDNYVFQILPDAHDAARQIAEAREDYEAALQGGKLPTTFGQSPQPSAQPANTSNHEESQQ